MSPDPVTLARVAATIRVGLGETILVVGICGAQGSGKSTLSEGLATLFRGEGVATAVLSIDDLYHTKAARNELGRTIHPLLRTRGVPGTHDVALGLRLIDELAQGRPALLPRFDKGLDDRAPPERWDCAPADTKLLILEGWCVGARPQPATALVQPVNALERDEDPTGAWRRYVNDQLGTCYRALFDRLDRLVLLAAPGFEIVLQWRIEQEQALRRGGLGMSDAQIARFIQHYERLTRHILAEMPARANVTLRLNAGRSCISDISI